jgi:hypothetical protein
VKNLGHKLVRDKNFGIIGTKFDNYGVTWKKGENFGA